MNSSLATPSVTTSLRRWWSRVWGDPDSRSVVIGVAGMLLIHLLLWFFAPLILRIHPVGATVRPNSTAREFNIELAPDTFVKPQEKPRDPFKFVETNPDAPENTPDKTTNFGAQNQQVAQPVPTPDGKSERPATEGKKDMESTQIVSGQLTRPLENLEPIAPPSELPVAEQTVDPARKEQTPLSGTEKFEGENKDGIGGSLAKRLANPSAVPERVEGVKDAPDFTGATSMQPAIDPKRPRPRPQVVRQPQVRPAVLSENRVGTNNVGVTAHNALMTTYGQYLQRMIEAVDTHWRNLNDRLRANPVIGSAVTVKFILNSDGLITKIVDVESSANETATRACISAISDPAPYSAWTDDMKQILGDQQELVFRFFYE